MKTFPFCQQTSKVGPSIACLQMLGKFYGRPITDEQLRQLTDQSREGVGVISLSKMAEGLGYRTQAVNCFYEEIVENLSPPCIIMLADSQPAVLYRIMPGKKLLLADPRNKLSSVSEEDLLHGSDGFGLDLKSRYDVLLITLSLEFYEDNDGVAERLTWTSMLKYLTSSRRQIVQVFLALLISSLFQLIFPLLTQSIVDIGINTKNVRFITIILVAQLILVFSRALVDFIRSRLLLAISAIMSLSILSDFWRKVMKLPMSYFDTHPTGDTLQRVNDNRQVQTFLTGTAFSTLFSLFNLIIFSILLLFYSANLFIIFCFGSVLYFLWIWLFLKVRRKINYETFLLSSKNNTSTLQLIQGMQEIKLHNAEQLKRWEWENIQSRVLRLGFKSLSISQIQQAGALFINQGTDAIVTFLVAKAVIDGQLTFGSMLAIQYVLGQVNSPIEQLIVFIQNAQDAKNSLERLNEINQYPGEEASKHSQKYRLPENKSISIKNLSFSYPDARSTAVLNDICFDVPEGKVTAIIGLSGSGKTTLLKLLLRFYENYAGQIIVGEVDLRNINIEFWRSQCGVVLQDGFIFNDTVLKNIAVGVEHADIDQLKDSCKKANILSFIETLPKGFDTKIGATGVGISQGQKQRILIARAIYKEPKYLFFDEATNSLDGNNEKEIMQNLRQTFERRTVIVVAHRLSTVRDADNILVFNQGKIEECGTHDELSALKGRYFELVRNQLELSK